MAFAKKIKILIINVSLRPDSKLICIPLGLAYVASAIARRGYDFDILDIDANRYGEDYIIKYLTDNKYDVVCMGCIVTGYKYIKRLGEIIKTTNPKAKIIVGNSVASSIPETLLTKTESDIAVIGEGDITIIEILDTLIDSLSLSGIKGIYYKDNGTIIKNNAREPIEDIDTIPFPNWNLFDMEKYIQSCSRYGVCDPLPIPRDKIRVFSISTARGCPFKCSFCYHVFQDVKYRYISPPVLIAELKRLQERYKIDYFLFHDDLSLISKRHARELIDFIQKENASFYWTACCRSDLFLDEEDIELAKQLRQAGCLGLSFSLENANPQILRMMNKRIDAKAFSRQCQILDKAGIVSWTSVIFGYPPETKKTIRQTIDCCIENGIYPSVGYLLPQPATPMYDYAVKHRFITNEEDYLLKLGDRQDLRINMTKMSDREMQDTVAEMLESCNKKLKLNLEKASLIKTGYYRSPKEIK